MYSIGPHGRMLINGPECPGGEVRWYYPLDDWTVGEFLRYPADPIETMLHSGVGIVPICQTCGRIVAAEEVIRG